MSVCVSAALESGGQLLAPLEQDLLLLWTGLVFLTLRELAMPRHAWVRSLHPGPPGQIHHVLVAVGLK